MKKSFSIVMLAAMLCVCTAVIGNPAYAGNDFDSWGLNAPPNDDTKTVILNSKTSPSSKIMPIDAAFTSADSKKLRLTMTGLTSANIDDMLDALEKKYLDSGEGSDIPIKVEDASFIDAEKWDVREPKTDYFFGYDTLQCWAASCANMLWLSGWTDGLVNPRTNQPFSSEDDIFEYYNVNFSDEGSNTDRGIDWFFMGEYYLSGFSNGAYKKFNSTGGLKPSFVSTVAQKQYDLIERPSDIECMLRVAATDPANRSVFEVTAGSLDAGELSSPLHAMTGIGLITDPGATNMAEKYKAIILIDSDNDASPSQADSDQRNELMSQLSNTELFSEEYNDIIDQLIALKNPSKEARTNSYTVYKLRYSKDINGIPYWEIVGYVDNETYAIYDIDELPCPSEKIINECTEIKGSKNVNSEVDLTIDDLFTTSNKESVPDPFTLPATKAKKNEFEQGDPVNINYFLVNRSNVPEAEDPSARKKVLVDWIVTRDSDGSTVASGSTNQEFFIPHGSETGAMLYLNKTASGYERWQPGAYTAKVSFNKDGKIPEAYYKNNLDKTVHFTVKGNAEPQKVTKATNTLKAAGKTVSLSVKKLKKKSCVIKRSKAISIKNAKGPVTYQKVQVSKKNKKNKYIKKAKYAKKIIVNKKTGKITVKKGLKKGTYKLKVKVTAAGNSKYKPATKTVTVKLKIKSF